MVDSIRFFCRFPCFCVDVNHPYGGYQAVLTVGVIPDGDERCMSLCSAMQILLRSNTFLINMNTFFSLHTSIVASPAERNAFRVVPIRKVDGVTVFKFLSCGPGRAAASYIEK